MKLPDFLTEVAYGEIRLTGHRIGLYHVVSRFKEGYSVEQIHEEYPTLSVDLIQKVVDFYLQNKAEADIYVAETEAELDRQYAAGKKLDLEELERRMRARGWPG
jgi:uncharacterized protein (DUF433 family)